MGANPVARSKGGEGVVNGWDKNPKVVVHKDWNILMCGDV